MKFHNNCRLLKPTIKNNLFEFVKEQVTFYYQWIIINDWLPRWVDNNIIESFHYNFKYKPEYINNFL